MPDLVPELGNGSIQLNEELFHSCLGRQAIEGFELLVNVTDAAFERSVIRHSLNGIRHESRPGKEKRMRSGCSEVSSDAVPRTNVTRHG